MATNVLQTIPILRIFNTDKAREFYIGFLGFTLDWEHRFHPNAPLYMQISRDGLVLHLTEHHGDCCPGTAVFVWMTGIDELHRELSTSGYSYMRPALDFTFYDAKCMEVIDPFGNRIRFNERLKTQSEFLPDRAA